MQLVTFESEKEEYNYSIDKNIMPVQSERSIIQFEPLPEGLVLVDDWAPGQEDSIFKSVDKAIILPVSKYYGLDNSTELDYFILSPKRCYNKPAMRQHTTNYLNYFEKFYDTEHELVIIYYQIKYMIDFTIEYNKTNLISDIRKYILYNNSILMKLFRMNEDNYVVELKAKKGKSIPSLQYTTKHGKILMQMSLLMNMVIPLITHFAHVKKVDNIDALLLEVFDDILDMSDVDIVAKIYETAMAEISHNASLHSTLWNMQSIRGKNTTTHAIASRENMILNICPKYTYNNNIISFNFSSIKRNTRLILVALFCEEYVKKFLNCWKLLRAIYTTT